MQDPIADPFPDDLSGHFWATLARADELDRWRVTVFDYQNNVMLTGLATTAFVNRSWPRCDGLTWHQGVIPGPFD